MPIYSNLTDYSFIKIMFKNSLFLCIILTFSIPAGLYADNPDSLSYLKLCKKIKKDKELHWYNFTFLGKGSYVSIPISFNKKRLTQKNLDKARGLAGVSKNSAMLDCTYLGKMTQKTFKEKE